MHSFKVILTQKIYVKLNNSLNNKKARKYV